jgi:hypothetical protein
VADVSGASRSTWALLYPVLISSSVLETLRHGIVQCEKKIDYLAVCERRVKPHPEPRLIVFLKLHCFGASRPQMQLLFGKLGYERYNSGESVLKKNTPANIFKLRRTISTRQRICLWFVVTRVTALPDREG